MWLASPMLAIIWHNPCSLVCLWRVRPCNGEPAHSLWLNEILQGHPIYSKFSVQRLLSLRKTGTTSGHSFLLYFFSGKMIVTNRATNPAGCHWLYNANLNLIHFENYVSATPSISNKGIGSQFQRWYFLKYICSHFV